MSRRVSIRVSGRVQGVAFRATARDEARRLGLSGFCRNEPDGSVSLEAEGSGPALDRFIAWCRAGPPSAWVERVEVREATPTGATDFVIVR